MLVFDIETGPRPEEELRAIFIEPTFEEFSAECDQRWKPETRVEKFEAHRATAWTKFVERAALSPVTGRILAIGLANPEKPGGVIVFDDSPTGEANMLQTVWRKFAACRAAGRSIVGFNIAGFDLPFMVRRSWLLGVAVPATIFDASGRYLDRCFVDLLVRWRCGNHQDSIRLADLSRFLSVGDKPKGINGADFHRLWSTDRAQATEYLLNDLAMTMRCAARMGVE